MLIIVTVLLNIGAIAVWSFITGQNGFKEAAKMLRGEAAFIRQETSDPTQEQRDAVEQGGGGDHIPDDDKDDDHRFGKS